MAVRISTSKFLESTVAKQTLVKVAQSPTIQPGGPLPAGIKNGVAKLTAIYFENDDKWGEGFRAEAEIVFPDVFQGQYIKGKITKQWITYTAENLDERLTRIGEILKNLGGSILGDGKTANYIKIVDFLDNVTKKSPIYFAFSTSHKDSGEWPWENWYQAIPGFVAPNTVVAASDQKKTPQSSNGQGTILSNGRVTTPEPWASRGSVVESEGYKSAPVDNGDNSTSTYSDSADLTSVVKSAGQGDQEAIDKLTEWAMALGYTGEDVDNTSAWDEVGEWVRSGELKGHSLGVPIMETTPKRVIKDGGVYTYEPPNKKPGGPRLNGRECRVTKVDNIREVVTLQNLAKKDEVFEVSFDDEYLK